MRIGGIVDISTKDIPGKATMVIFTIGCNFRCNFCHNKHLLNHSNGNEVSTDRLLSIIKSNQLVSSVSISGGEPTLQKDLKTLVEKIKNIEDPEAKKYISIDSNGSNPDLLQQIFPYVDRIALDIKAPFNQKRYEEIVNNEMDIGNIERSYFLINKQKILDFEIRTTYVKNLLEPIEIHNILNFLIENDFRGNFVLQQYQYSEGVGDAYKEIFTKPEHGELIHILKPYSKANLSKSLKFKILLRDDVIGYMELNEVLDKII